MRLLPILAALAQTIAASTISVVPVFEPVSLHGTDVDGEITETGEALQATVVSRPMALTGAFPEALVEAVVSPNRLPSNHPNYKVEEANLLVLCGVVVRAEMSDDGLLVRFNVAGISIPDGVDLTIRQVLRLGMLAVRKTLEAYQAPQTEPLQVILRIDGTDEGTASLNDLEGTYTLGGE